MEMYGRRGSFTAQPGKGQLLASLLLEAASGLGANPDCHLYVVERTVDEPDVVSVYEAWTSKEAHAASLQDAGTIEVITRARPLIAGMSEGFEFIPVGGKGLAGR